MTAFSWANGVSGDWSTIGDWSPSAGAPPNAATADATIAAPGAYNVAIASTESFLVDSLTFDPATGASLTLGGTLTLGGVLAEMTESSGTVNFYGTLAGGTLTLSGGLLDDTGPGVISSAVSLSGGTVEIASGKTLTLSGAVTLASGDAQINGPGILLTTGTTTITATPYLDGNLIWHNTGTVSAGAEINTGYPSDAGTVTIANLAGGAFDLTADGEAFNVYYNGSSALALSNAGVLSKTGGTGTSNISVALTNTGTLTATSGTLELDGGGTLGGTVTETTTGAVTLGAGVFALTGTINGAGTLTIDPSATLSIGTAETIANPTVLEGTVTIASGKTLTLSGAVALGPSYDAQIDGPGILLTTGTTTITATPYLDGNLIWHNTGTVSAGAEINTGYPSDAGTVTIANLAGGAFDLTADGEAFNVYYNGGSTLLLSNAGVLSKTGGTGTSNISVALTNTGTLTATSGTLELDGGGTLGGTVTETTTGAVTLGAGVFALTGTINGAGTLTIDPSATLSIGTAETIANPTVLEGTVTIASGKTLTLSGAVALGPSYDAQIDGPGILLTTGTTTITATPYLDGNLIWHNTGTVSAGAEINTGYPSDAGTVTIANLAGGAFDLTADGEAFNVYYNGGSTLLLSNAGVLSKTGGTGTSNISVALTNTGTLTATSGTLELDGGGTLGGTVTETATGAVTLGAGVFALTGTINGAGTLTVDSAATLAIGTASQSIGNAVVLDGEVTIASGKTLTLTGPVALGPSYDGQIDGPGTLLTTGTTTITATSYLDGNLIWHNSGTVAAGAQIETGYPSDTGTVTIANLAGGAFDLTADGEAFNVYYNGGSTLLLSNAGVLSKTGGTGTSNISVALTNTGTLTATSGTLELDAGGTLGGVMGATGAGALALGAGTFTLGGTTQTITGALLLDGANVDIASGKTLTLSGAVNWSSSDVVGPGTLATAGTTTISNTTYIDGGLTWTNSGTVLDGFQIGDGAYSASGLNYAVINQASGTFDFTADGFDAFYNYDSETETFTNAGLLEKTAGTGAIYFEAALNNTGTVSVSSGILQLDSGGTLGGVVNTSAGGELEFAGGAFSETGTLTNGGTLAVIAGSVAFTAPNETIANTVMLSGGTLEVAGAQTLTLSGAVGLDGAFVDIASGQTLTLSGAVTWDNSDVVGPGTLATTGTTTISAVAYIDGGLIWTNSGTVLDGEPIYTDDYLGSSTLTNTVVNQATGVFDFTSDGFDAVYLENSAPITFTNAGLLEKTAGTGFLYFTPGLNNTGTVSVSSGILQLDSGGTLGGVVNTSAGGELEFAGGAFSETGTLTNGGTLAVIAGSVAFTAPNETIANTVMLSGGTLEVAGAQTLTLSGAVGLDGAFVDIASGQTLTLSGAVTWDNSDVVGPGTLATTGTTTISAVAYIDGGLIWTNSGTVLDGEPIYTDDYLGSSTLTNTVVNQATGVFDFTSDGFDAVYLENSAPITFTNAGLLEKTAGTGFLYFTPGLNNTGTVSVSSGILQLDSGGTLGGVVNTSAGGELEFAGGAFSETGTLTNGGTLAVIAGSVAFTAPNETIANTVMLSGGTLEVAGAQTLTLSGAVGLDGAFVDIASGQTLTLSGAVTWDTSDVVGPGTLATTGTTTISNYAYIDGGLTWTNSGTVLDGFQIGDGAYSASGLNYAVINQASGTFDFTADGFDAFYNYDSETETFTNAGLLEKTAGTGALTFTPALNTTGTVTASSGILDLQNGGALGGVIGATGAGEIALGSGTFTLAQPTQTITGAVGLLGGGVDIASGQTLTLSGAVTWNSSDVYGLGTLATTGTTTIVYAAYFDSGLTWNNSGTVLDGSYIYDGYYSASGLNFAINNLASGTFDFTADGYYAFSEGDGAAATFTNAGLLEKTAATGTSYFDAALNSTGTVTASSGVLEFMNGGTLGGVIGATGAGEIAFGGGTFTLGGATQTITGAVELTATADVDIASGQTLTLSGAVNVSGQSSGAVVGPGTLATTDTTTIGPNGLDLDGGLTWNNTGTVLVGGETNAAYPSGVGGVTIDNLAGGVFDITTAEPVFTSLGSSPLAFDNAGLLESTAATGTVTFNAPLNNTGTVTTTHGTLDFDAGGTLNGTIGGTGAGLVWLDAGGPFVTTGTLAILDAGTSNDLRLVNGATLTDSGTIDDSGRFELGNGTGASALVIAAGAKFYFTADDGQIINGVSASLSNAGTLGKIGGTGTSTVGFGFTNTGTVDAASGTLKFVNGINGTGRLQIEASDTLELGSGAVAGNNTIDFNGLGATLKIDTNSTVNKSIIGLGGGSRIDLTAASSVAAVINGNTLTITPTGGSALNFVSTGSLANLHITTGSDGGTGTVVTLYNEAAASAHTPQPVAFGNVHVGANVQQALTITNTAPAGIYTEKLDGTLTSNGTGYTASGSFTGLGGGISNSTSLDVVLNTTNTGTISGTGTLTLYSDGSGVDGFGTTALPTQTVNVSGAVYALASPVVSTTPNPTVTPLVNFTAATGSNPLGNLIADAAGDLFGVASGGGANGDGAVFEIAKTAGGYASTPTTLASFNVTDGENPIGNLIADGAGDLFGTTHGGGPSGDGTVFEIAKTAGGYASTPTVLASFNGANGQNPYAGLVADSAGDLFGTTLSGGGGNGTGTIFEIVKTSGGYASTPTTLFNFNDTNGGSPRATMIIDGSGDLFGTTIGGGSYGYGTVFELAKIVSGYTTPPAILANFSSGGIGDYPWSSLIEDAAGDLFGTTTQGNGGEVFEVVNTSTGYATGSAVMPTFLANAPGFPIGNLTADAAGNLFGTTSQGGPDGDGTLFEVAKTSSGYASGATTLVSFDGTNGSDIQYGLLADSSGDLFGTALSGGASNDGTAFELNGSGFQTPGTLAVDFGAARVGGTIAAQTVTISNGTTATAYQESLVYNLLSGLPAGFAAGANDSGTIAAGGTETPTLLLNTSTAGDFIDSADTITLVSTGVGTSGLANTNLTAPTLTLDGEVFAAAIASVSANTVNFGAVHTGQIVNAMTLGVTNTATGAVTDILVAGSVTEAGNYTGTVTPSLGTGLAAGAAGTVTFGLATSTTGLQSGTVDLGFLSRDGVLNDLTLAAVPITVTGTVYNYATASAAAPNPVNFGEQHVGATLTQALSLTNVGSVGGFTENLDASVGGPTGAATTNGGFTGLAAGASNSTSLTVGLNSALDGAQSGAATVTLASDGAGVDGLGTTALAAQTIAVEGTLYNYAAPILSGPSLEVGSATTPLAPDTAWGGSLGGLIEDANGDLLGTTRTAGDGTVFEIANTSTGYASTANYLVNFTGPGGSGDQPEGGLLANAAGDLFGTTYGYGNAYSDDGTVFELANTGTGYASTPTTLVSFDAADGAGPLGSLIENAAGDLFGETQNGGPSIAGSFGGQGYGTVFEIANTSTGYASTPTTLVSFNGPDGVFPTSGLAMDAAGDLFGMTTDGGATYEPVVSPGQGTVFEIVNTSTGYASTPTTLLTFNFENWDAEPPYGGYDPFGGVLVDAAGDVFGTTPADSLGNGGPFTGGSVFELVNTGSGYTLNVLSNDFPNGNIYPLAGLVSTLTEDAEGDLFGTTFGGALFELVKTGGTYASTPTLLSSSIGSSEENSGAPLLNAAGDVFVATYEGGAFEVSPTYTLDFGEQHVGATLSQALRITNGGTADGFTEKLDASIGNATGSATANGSFTGLAAGITNSTSLIVDLNSGMAGAQSGTATVTLTSDGTGIDTLGTTALQAQTITVEGTIYNYATASAVSPNPVNFGIVHVGTAVSDTLSVTNLAPAGSFSENLDASIGGATSGVTVNGSFTGLGGSATNTTSLAVGLNTSTAGTISGMATITLVSDGAGIDTLGTTMLAAQTVTVSGTVNNYATAAIEAISGNGTLTQAGTAYTLALGKINLGTSSPDLNFGVVNAATGPADVLGGSFTVNGDGGGAFINTLTAFSNVAAGNFASGDEVSLSSATAGAFSETITLLANGSNSSSYLGALPEEIVTVTGSVVAVARTMIWTGTSDTNFANAMNWNDTTSGLDPAIVAPNTTDTAEFNSGGVVITGTGTAAVLLFNGAGAWHVTSGASLTASGSVIVGANLTTALLIDQGSSLIDAGSAVIANTTSASGSSVTVTGAGSDWGIAGTLEVGNATSGTLDIASGATVSALDVTIGNASGLVSVGTGSELLLGAGGELTVNGTLANYGAVSGGGSPEVAFGSGTDRLILGPSATFGGNVVGGGVHTTLELAAGSGAGTLNALGTTFTNFGTVTVDAGATWTVDSASSLLATTTFIGDGAGSTLVLSGAGTFSLANVSNFGTIDLPAGNNTVTVTDKTLSGGSVTIVDGASGNNSVSAASDTSASKGKSLTYDTGSGTDSFTGGFENDTVDVSVAALSGDTLTGGSGTNTLVLTTAGVLNLSGVSKFSTIDLAAGNSTVTVTDAMLSLGSLTINDGASGNNTVSAAGDTSASKGKTLTYNAGTGTDSFTGGFENDKVNVAATAVGGDTLTGGSGTNTLTLSSAGSANLGGVSKFATIDLAAGNSTVTVTDTTLSGGSVVIVDGASGNNSISAAGDTSASTGKTLTYDAGSGTDSFTGGFENDAVHVSATAVGGDTLTGGSGTNSLVLTSAGSVNLAGVSRFGTINLAAGNNTVTVTDTTLSGGSAAVADGSSGNNTVSAATDTSASVGKTLTYYTGSGTDSFTGGFENDQVHVSAAAVGGDTLTGGSGSNTLALSSAGSVNLGGVSKFGTINLLAGNSTVTVTNKTLSGGSAGVHDGASGNNTISAASDTAASNGKSLTYFAGAGTDSFTGGYENDTVDVSAAAVGGDTLTGGRGSNTLTLTTAGSANLGGVSKFATIDLASGNSTVTVTDTTLSGGSVSLHDGSSGNNSVSAAGDTSASTGKVLVYYAGPGVDTFTGGFENDTVHVTAAAVGGDTLTGGSGTNTLALSSSGTANLSGVSNFATIDLTSGNTTVYASAAQVSSVVLAGGTGGNTLVLTSAGTVNLSGVSEIATIDLAAGNNTVTVTDKTLTGPSVTINDGASGNTSISATGDTSASHGKNLIFDAGTGTDSLSGGFENDLVHVSAAALGGDTLSAGSGVNTLTLTSAGTVNLGTVSKFATIDLASGNNTVTVTDTTLSGGSVGLHHGTSGNNSVSAAGDTSASTGKGLTYFAGPGTDSFIGGFENDTVDVTAAAVAGDTLTGGSGHNSLVLTSNGSINLGGVSKFATIDLAAGNSTVTLTNTTLSGGSVALVDGASGNETVSAATDTSASTGKTLTYYTGIGTDHFTGGFENDAVHVSAAAVAGDTLTGGSGSNSLVLSSAGSVNLGGVSKFATIDLAAGNSTVTVTDTTLSGGSAGVHDGASGNNSVNASGDTAASTGKLLTDFTGAGTDSFTGGFENDTVNVTAAAVGGDTLTGGSGSNTLKLSSAGSVNLGGVSRFGTVDLAAGNSTVTVTDTTLSGGSVTINDGTSGSNTISAAGDTSASSGKSLTYVAGSGTPGFAGGFENDTIYAGAGAGTFTAGSGNDTFVFIKSSLPNQTLDNFQVANDDILVYGNHSTGGFDLGSTDNALNPTSPTAIDPSIFIASASGDFTNSTQRFAYDTSNGQLHYSATGSNTSESLIATLTGEPAISASNFLFEH